MPSLSRSRNVGTSFPRFNPHLQCDFHAHSQAQAQSLTHSHSHPGELECRSSPLPALMRQLVWMSTGQLVSKQANSQHSRRLRAAELNWLPKGRLLASQKSTAIRQPDEVLRWNSFPFRNADLPPSYRENKYYQQCQSIGRNFETIVPLKYIIYYAN